MRITGQLIDTGTGAHLWADRFEGELQNVFDLQDQITTRFEYLTVGGVKMPLPFTTRMTVVRLSNGDLFLHSPIKFDGRLANELLGLGAVRHLVSPNQFHYAHIGEWAMAFPNTVSWASPRVRERARARHVDVDFTRDLEASPPEEWGREIDQTLFPGGLSR